VTAARALATAALLAAVASQHALGQHVAPEEARSGPVDERVGPIPGPGEPTSATNPYANDPAMLADGRRLFVAMNCSGCHGGHAGGGMGPSLRDDVWIYGGSDADVYDSIAQGRAYGMPSWGQLPPDVIWRLTAYVQSLRTPQEPDRPR
jgi:cytochrome c oxidase cbb3-type subunit 3